jgi:LysR family transcriptional regulator, low CO2-responsive transcriptional regulator
MKDVSLRQLRFLGEVVRTGSLAAAAQALHLTAPAVAQQLRLLERGVGLTLLERGPGGQRPTEAGRLLVDAGHRIETELAVCDEALHSLRSATAGQVTLGAVSTAKYFAPHVLAAFRRSHPGVTIALHIGNRDEILARLEDFEIDLAVMGRPPQGLQVEQEVFGDHPYVVIASPTHPLAGRRDVPLERIAAETFLSRERGSGTRQHLDSLFTSAGIERVSAGMELASNETIKQAAMAGLGIALISAHTVAAEVNDGRLAVLHVRGLPIHRHWLVVRMRRRAFSPATAALWDFVVAQAAPLLPVLVEAKSRRSPYRPRQER